MAAGAVNTTRQLGYALGIAALGVIFQPKLASVLAGSKIAGSSRIAGRLASGQAHAVLATASSGGRKQLDLAIHSAFAAGLNVELLACGALGLLGAAVVALMVRPERVQAETARPDAAQSSVLSG